MRARFLTLKFALAAIAKVPDAAALEPPEGKSQPPKVWANRIETDSQPAKGLTMADQLQHTQCMKILLATDGSPCSRAAVEELIRRPWPEASEVRVLSVAQALPTVPDPFFVGVASHLVSLEQEQKRAVDDAEWARNEIATRKNGLTVSTHVPEGSPKAEIIKDAAEWGADLIMLGSHGRGAIARFLLGSVSQSVVLHAPCSVEVVRSP